MSEMTGIAGWPANRFEELFDIMSDGGIEASVRFNKIEDTPIFEFRKDSAPTVEAVAAASETARLFASDAQFKDWMVSFCIHIGAAVHGVDEPAWQFRTLTSAENAAISADEPRLNS